VNDVSQKLSSLIPQDSNTSNVEHYVIPDEKYSARKGNLFIFYFTLFKF